MFESAMYRLSSQNAPTSAPTKPSFGLANRSAFPAPDICQQNNKKYQRWKKQSLFKKKMMVRPVIEDSDEEGNANLTSSDESSSCAQSETENYRQGGNNSQRNGSINTKNKMADMLDGFSNGRGLGANNGMGNKDDSVDFNLSDAGVESIILSSEEDKDN